MENTKLSPPWWEFYQKMEAMFGQDPEIHINFDEKEMVLKLFVDSQPKAGALTQVLPSEKEFGNVTLKIEIVPSNKAGDISQLYKTAFNGNPVFSNVIEIDQPGLPHFSYVIFKPLVVQFYDDNLMDAYGNVTTLHQDIARDIFDNEDGVYFCTENMQNKE